MEKIKEKVDEFFYFNDLKIEYNDNNVYVRLVSYSMAFYFDSDDLKKFEKLFKDYGYRVKKFIVDVDNHSYMLKFVLEVKENE